MPIVDKPLIQFAAEEVVASGIDTLIFVTGRNKRAIEDHFDRNKELELALVKTGKVEQAKMVANILPKGIECIFVRQPEQLGLGHAVLCAERVVGNEPFAVLLADDFIVDNETTTLTSMIEAYYKSEKSQISVIEVMGAEISNYGVVKKSSRDGKITGIVEKPTESEAPSNLASIGRYVLNPKIFARLRALGPGRNDEIQLADALNDLAKDEELEAVSLSERDLIADR